MLKLANKLFAKMFIADKWNVGFINQSVQDLVEQKKLKDIVWLKEDTVDYAADPFVVNINDKINVYYEELSFWYGKGKIMLIEGFDFSTKRQVNGISPSSIHLSYPYLYKKGKKLYCIPETSKAKEVALYTVNAFKPALLNKHKLLISGKEYVDSSVVLFASKYWLFSSVSGENQTLYIFYASAIDGPYHGHKLNPIPVEKNACRGAGSMFFADNVLYRPTQNLSNHYGGSIQINKICILNESEYASEPIFEILPDSSYNRGIHHMSFTRDKIVVDGKRQVREFFMPLKKLVKMIRK